MENGYYAGWGTLALINAGLAQGKNRSGMNWFLLSLLLGPFRHRRRTLPIVQSDLLDDAAYSADGYRTAPAQL